jgi:hypothetical protein
VPHQVEQTPQDTTDITQAWFMRIVVRLEQVEETPKVMTELFGDLELNLIEVKNSLQGALRTNYLCAERR